MAKVSNWISAGKRSKKMDTAIINIHTNRTGKYVKDEYVQITIYSKEKEKFTRLEFTLEEAKYFQDQLNEKMKIFNGL